MSARAVVTFGSLLDLHVDARASEGELHALRRRDDLDGDAVLVLHRGHTTPARRRQARAHGGVVAVEVVDALQVVHLARSLDLRHADVTYGKTLHVDRVVLALVAE